MRLTAALRAKMAEDLEVTVEDPANVEADSCEVDGAEEDAAEVEDTPAVGAGAAAAAAAAAGDD